jgi:hypothetical protein
MKRYLYGFASTLAVLVLATGARADFIPVPNDQVQWTYNWSPGTNAISADSPGTGGVSFTNEPTKSATGSSDIVATNLRIFSVATAQSPDKLSTNGNYTLSLALKDVASGQAGTITFSGKLTGSFSADNSNIFNTINGSPTHTLTLGNTTYTVTFGPYSPPGPPSASNAGSISAHVDVSGVSIATVPEPSTMILSALGLSFMGVAGWRRRQKAAA